MASFPTIVQIIRHGESLHNVDRSYSCRDPPLTEKGLSDASLITVDGTPDLIILSPMTRTIQTAIQAFGPLISGPSPRVQVAVWPELREAHDAVCNKGLSKAEMTAKFPNLDFGLCPDEWSYPPHTVEGATARAEAVRGKLEKIAASRKNIAIVTHRGFIAFLVSGSRFNTCEVRSYRFANAEEVQAQRHGVHTDTLQPHDFGPTLLMPVTEDIARIPV